QDGSFDLVLMDIQMPVLDGVEALEHIRKWESTKRRPQTRVIAVTADTRPEQKQELRRRGFDDFLPKPLRKNHLLAVIKAQSVSSKFGMSTPARVSKEAANDTVLE